MFERYTDKARRIVFFARYEASEFGSAYIEAHHLLLGWLRESRDLTVAALVPQKAVLSIRQKVAERFPPAKPRVATSVDLPLSGESKRALAFAAEEAERLRHRPIGPEHLLLGLLRVEDSFAAALLRDVGVSLDAARTFAAQSAEAHPESDHHVLYPIVEALPDDRTAAAIELLEALAWERVSITVSGSGGAFSLSFGLD